MLCCPPPQQWLEGVEGRARVAHNVPSSRATVTRRWQRTWCHPAVLSSPSGGWERAEREQHATCLSLANATCMRRCTWCCPAALSSQAVAGGGRERSASGKQRASLSRLRRRRRTRCCRVALPSPSSGWGGRIRVLAASNVPASRDCAVGGARCAAYGELRSREASTCRAARARHTRCRCVALPSGQRRNTIVPVLCSRNTPSAVHMVLPRGAARAGGRVPVTRNV
jgi:hypothetical protein